LLFLNIRETNNEELFEADLDFLLENKDFEPNIYNIWNQSKADVGNDYYGQFPLSFMKNLLYYHTQPYWKESLHFLTCK
jgi:hypothetical protein